MKTIACIFVIALFATLSMAADDPFLGKWILDVNHSHYPAGTSPASMTIEMERAGDGVHYRSSTIYVDGRTSYAEYTANYDGNQSIVMGQRGMMLPVFLKRIDSHTVLASYTRNLQIVATSRRVVSADGLRLTITTISKTASGTTSTTIGVYHKE